MPDKQKDSKIMSMLERSGIVRRADADSSDEASDDAQRIESDIRPLFDHDEETVMLKTAARQPVPGMTTPILPTEKPAGVAQERQQTVGTADSSTDMLSVEDTISEFTAASEAEEQASVQSFTEPPAPIQAPTPAPEPVQSREQPRPVSALSNLNPFRASSAATDTSAMESVLRDSEREPQMQVQPQPENYTDRYLNVNELYDALALRSKKTESVYLIEEYLQTLPGSLPDSQRRDIVSKLIVASGFDFDLLMGDGVLRVKMLKEYAERFARHTDDYIAARQAELEELDQQMARTRRLIENRKELHKKQFYTIEAEAQRLKEILTFISG